LFTACVNLMYVGRPAVMVLAILAARHRTFVLVVTSLFVLFIFPTHNKFLLLLLLLCKKESSRLNLCEITRFATHQHRPRLFSSSGSCSRPPFVCATHEYLNGCRLRLVVCSRTGSRGCADWTCR